MERSLGIAIIGAGMTGLTVAEHLVKAGRDVRILDKGRHSGGRISTRRTERGLFDHGAPEIHVTSTDFDNFLKGLGAISDGNGGRFGLPGMRSLFDPLTDRLDIRTGVEISEILRESRGWVLRTTTGRSFAHFHTVVVTTPAPQAAAMIRKSAPDLSEQVENVRMHPVWTCMVEFEERLDLPGTVEGKGAVMRADRMSAKPRREDGREAWVIHMTPEFAREQLFADPAVIAPIILDTFAETYAIDLPRVRYLDAHRWRFAFAEQPLGRPFLGDPAAGLLIGGDWALGDRAEHGFESGSAMAEAILSREIVNV